MCVLQPQPMRGAALLLAHCSAVSDERESAYTRLVHEVGGEFARLLVFALTGPKVSGARPSGTQGLRGSSSP